MKWSTSFFVSVLGCCLYASIGLAAEAAQNTAMDMIVYNTTTVYDRITSLIGTLVVTPIATYSSQYKYIRGGSITATLPDCTCDLTATCQESSVTTPNLTGNVQSARRMLLETTEPAWATPATAKVRVPLYSSVPFRAGCEKDERGVMRTLTLDSVGENCPQLGKLWIAPTVRRRSASIF
jgi:hypothetical protein